MYNTFGRFLMYGFLSSKYYPDYKNMSIVDLFLSLHGLTKSNNCCRWDFIMSDLKFVNRLKGPLPKIGIRPTIDGRRKGVRESLEDQTMGMAKAVAKLFESKLRHPTGHPVECIIADSTIGGVAEAAACAEKFALANVGVSLTVTPCWCYGSETMDMNPSIPKAVWGFNGTEKPGAVYLAAVLAGHNQKGLPAFGIYGKDVQDINDTEIPKDVEEKLLRFAKAGLAVAWMKGKSYLSIGSVSMGIAGSIVNPEFFEKYLGMRAESVDESEIIRRLNEGIYDPEEAKKAIAWTKANCIEGEDPNEPDLRKSKEKKDQEWEISVKMAMIMRDLMVGNPNLAKLDFGEESLGHNAILAGFQGQRQWTDFMPNGDFPEAILNSSFDWNGIRQPYLLATENDALNGAAMLFGHLLTNTAQIFADVRTYWSPEAVKRVTGIEVTGMAKDGFIHLINSGPAALDGTGQMTKDGKPAIKPFWEIQPEEVEKCLKATKWEPGITTYFRGGGFSTCFLSKGSMPMTMSRINLIHGLGPVLQIAEGFTVDLPAKVHEVLDKRTNWTWPTTWFVPRLTGKGAFTSVYSVMNNWGANHCALSYGHIGADLITLASMLRIPVCMHNVQDQEIFRPSAWSAFGTQDLEGADYRACQNFGSLY
jgi:L-fucose isomerase